MNIHENEEINKTHRKMRFMKVMENNNTREEEFHEMYGKGELHEFSET